VKLQSNIAEFAETVKRDALLWKSGLGDSVGQLMIDGINNILQEGFVQGPRKVNFQYPEAPGMDVLNTDKKLVFRAGKVVDRSGKLPADLEGLSLVVRPLSDVLAYADNGKSHITVTQGEHSIKATLELPERRSWGMLEYGKGGSATSGSSTGTVNVDGEKTPDRKLGQRRIIRRGFAVTLKVWDKIVKNRLDKWLARMSKP